MKTGSLLYYLLNCLWLIVPIMLWNGIFSGKLPAAFQADSFDSDIPAFIVAGENFFRLVVFILPVFMPLTIASQMQKLGLGLYLAGTALYFLAWVALMYFPQSAWSLSAPGFLAPAYTPLIWLVGIGLIGSALYFSSPYQSWMYIVASVIFVGFHVAHPSLVYARMA
jgi:hypothetical protein